MTEDRSRGMTEERLRQFSAAWTAGDLDALMSFMTEDCVYSASVGPEPGTTYRGRAEVRHGFAEMLRYDRGRARDDGAAVVHGDLGFAEWSFTGTAADGTVTVIRGCDIFEFAGDRIRRKDAFRKVLAPALEPAGTPSTTRPSDGEATPGYARYFADKLAYETDPADVRRAMEDGEAEFLVVDCRPAGNYNKAHIPGAVNLPWREITQERIRDLPDLPLVTYCWGPSCNAATKGAYRLAALGRPVKEMIGGLEYWIREGHPTEGRRPPQRGQGAPSDWGLTV